MLSTDLRSIAGRRTSKFGCIEGVPSVDTL